MCLSCVYCPAWLNNHRPQYFSKNSWKLGATRAHLKILGKATRNWLPFPQQIHLWMIPLAIIRDKSVKNTIPASTCHHLGGHCYNWLQDSPKREIVPESMRTLIIHWRSSCWIFFCLLFSCLQTLEQLGKIDESTCCQKWWKNRQESIYRSPCHKSHIMKGSNLLCSHNIPWNTPCISAFK